MSKAKKEPVERADEEKSGVMPAEPKKAKKTQPKKAAKQERAAEKPAAKAKQPTESKSGKKPAKGRSPKESAPSSKTPQVLKLVQPHGDYVNPVIVAGKSSIPKQLRGVEPLSRIMRREAKAVLGEDITGLPEENEEVVTINLTAVAIAENAAEILRRFNACDCEKCVSALTKLVEEKVPARFVRISRSAAENGELDEQKEPTKKAVVAQMIRVLMGNKKRSFHEE